MGNQQEKIPKELHDQLIRRARKFRKNPTEAETELWDALRGRKLGGYKFKRQRVFGPFILDFYCPECKLAIELDGEIHSQQYEYDSVRTEWLQTSGVTVIRFRNTVVLNDTELVLQKIINKCGKLTGKK